MTLSKKRLAVATVIASVTLGSSQSARAQVRIERPNSATATQAAPVLVNFRAQASGAGASGQAGGAAAAGAAGAPGGTGAGTAGAAITGGAGALPGGASGQASPGATSSFGGTQLGGAQIIGGAGTAATGTAGIGDATGAAQPEALPSGSTGQLTPLMMRGVRDPIEAADISVEQIGTQVIPEDQASQQISGVLPLPGGQDRGLDIITYRWQAANICHWPLYFEEPMLERHGQQRCPTYLQPAVSGVKFFTNVALYPYKATLWPACESRYTLGHFRPGSPVPMLRETLPWSRRAALVQGAAVTGVAVGLPW